MNPLLDLRTLAEIQDAAPRVSSVSFETARLMVQTMRLRSEQSAPKTDVRGVRYWQASLKELHALSGAGESLGLKSIGRTVRAMGLEVWRQFDGYHAAWSETQLAIFQRRFFEE